MPHDLVDSPDQAVENILRYQTEVMDEPRLAGRMKQVHVWYAVRSKAETWLFAPSKFVGYAENTASSYLTSAGERDGRRTEAVLRSWFETVKPLMRRATELADALQSFIEAHGFSGPRKNARICVLKGVFARAAGAAPQEIHNRIRIDATICGGRPHIRGTRVRVSDLLDMLADGVYPSEILADYPYLREADLRAALAFGAAASAHRIFRIDRALPD